MKTTKEYFLNRQPKLRTFSSLVTECLAFLAAITIGLMADRTVSEQVTRRRLATNQSTFTATHNLRKPVTFRERAARSAITLKFDGLLSRTNEPVWKR